MRYPNSIKDVQKNLGNVGQNNFFGIPPGFFGHPWHPLNIIKFEKNVLCTLSNHDFVQFFRYLEDVKDVQKNLWSFGQNNFWQQNIWDYRFYWHSLDKEKGLQVKTLIIPENLKILLSRYLKLICKNVFTRSKYGKKLWLEKTRFLKPVNIFFPMKSLIYSTMTFTPCFCSY